MMSDPILFWVRTSKSKTPCYSSGYTALPFCIWHRCTTPFYLSPGRYPSIKAVRASTCDFDAGRWRTKETFQVQNKVRTKSLEAAPKSHCNQVCWFRGIVTWWYHKSGERGGKCGRAQAKGNPPGKTGHEMAKRIEVYADLLQRRFEAGQPVLRNEEISTHKAI